MKRDIAAISESPRPAYQYEKLAAKIARIFDDAEIPSVLWGSLAMHCYGSPYGDLPDFVIPDHLVESAREKLLNAGFLSCDQVTSCVVGSYPQWLNPGRKHVHTMVDCPGAIIYLDKQSDLLLPDFELGPPAADDRYFTLSNDERLPPKGIIAPAGPWPSHFYPVKIPTAACIIETTMFLCCRDYKADNHDYFSRWWGDLVHALNFMHENVNDQDLLPHFQSHWRDSSIKKLIELREKLLEMNQLPPPPDCNISNT